MKKPPYKNQFCPKPFHYFEVGAPKEGTIPCYSCCPTILPKVTGNLAKQSLKEVWNSASYQEIRESITDGSYKFCSHELCPEIQTENLISLGTLEDKRILKALETKLYEVQQAPDEINLGYDRVCNLSCPSCRTEAITNNSEEEDQLMERITNEILSQDLSHTRLIVCSSGDPFVSKHFRKLLFDLDGEKYPGLKIQIMTNGLMFNQSAWEKMHKIHKNIEMCCVSIDAATEETYKITRRGGSWKNLHENLRFLSGLRMRGELSFLRFDCVVQDYNFRELPAFVEMGEQYKVDQVFFQKIANWGTYTESEYKERCIYDEAHPRFNEFFEIINRPELKRLVVNPGNFGHWIKPEKGKKPFNLKNAIFHSLRRMLRELKIKEN